MREPAVVLLAQRHAQLLGDDLARRGQVRRRRQGAGRLGGGGDGGGDGGGGEGGGGGGAAGLAAAAWAAATAAARRAAAGSARAAAARAAAARASVRVPRRGRGRRGRRGRRERSSPRDARLISEPGTTSKTELASSSHSMLISGPNIVFVIVCMSAFSWSAPATWSRSTRSRRRRGRFRGGSSSRGGRCAPRWPGRARL